MLIITVGLVTILSIGGGILLWLFVECALVRLSVIPNDTQTTHDNIQTTHPAQAQYWRDYVILDRLQPVPTECDGVWDAIGMRMRASLLGEQQS